MCMIICGATDSVLNEDLVRAVEEKIRENRRFTITSLSLHFLKFRCHFFTKVCVINISFRNCAEDAYGRKQIETAGQYIGLSVTIQ